MQSFKSQLLLGSILVAATATGGSALADDAPASNPGPTLSTQSAVAAPDSVSPYQLKLQYTGEAWDNAEGGTRRGDLYMQQIYSDLRVDTGKAFGWTGGKFDIEGFYAGSRSIGGYVGAVQDPSYIDTDGTQMIRLYQAYYDQSLGDTDLLFGVYDLETEFGNTQAMSIFFNGAYAWTSTLDASGMQGLNGPSTYPNTSLAFRARQKIADDWSVQAAVLDGMADNAQKPENTDFQFNGKFGALAIGEVDYTPAPRTQIMAGYWDYTGKFTTQNEFNPNGSARQVYGSDGGYIGASTRLYTIEGKRGLDGFANIGIADPTVNEVDRSFNAGLSFTGLLEARPADKFGLAMGIVGAGGAYRNAQIAQGSSVDNYETNFELTYRAPINKWLTVQPDVEYWVHPNFDPTLKNDLLIGVHFEVGHWFGL